MFNGRRARPGTSADQALRLSLIVVSVATPGTLTCGGITHPTTSGSGPANAIQLTDGSGVFVVKEIPLFGFVHGGGIPEGNLQTCVLSEPSIPESPITVIGVLTPAR